MRWEYYTVEWRGAQALDAEVARLGNDGWQLTDIYVSSPRDQQVLFFMRAVGG
jgi:hypothetical protein